MGNQQSNAGAAKFFGGVTDLITAPVNQATQLLVGQSVIPSASAAIAASNDPNVNSNAGKTQTAVAISGLIENKTGMGFIGNTQLFQPNKPPANMACAMAVGRDKPTLNADSKIWYCGTGNDADRSNSRMDPNLKGQRPTPVPTEQWTGGGAITNNPPGTGYTPNMGPQQQWSARPGDGVSPPPRGNTYVPSPNAPQSDDPMQLNPQFNITGANDGSNKVVLGGSANQLSVHQGFPNLNSSPALPQAAAAAPVPAIDSTSLLMIGGAVVVGAVLLAKKRK